MKKNTPLTTAAILAVILALGLAVRMQIQKSNFDKLVREGQKTSEGYDQKFIAMVEALEEELTMRASFGYEGGKDPMTGKKRKVVLPVRRRKPKKAKKGPKKVIDPVKLTAIIFEDEKRRFTAVVMDGERSFSVEVGDRVRGRKITRITNEAIFMEDRIAYYKYDIYGASKRKKK